MTDQAPTVDEVLDQVTLAPTKTIFVVWRAILEGGRNFDPEKFSYVNVVRGKQQFPHFTVEQLIETEALLRQHLVEALDILNDCIEKYGRQDAEEHVEDDGEYNYDIYLNTYEQWIELIDRLDRSYVAKDDVNGELATSIARAAETLIGNTGLIQYFASINFSPTQEDMERLIQKIADLTVDSAAIPVRG